MKRAHALDLAKIAELCRETHTDLTKLYQHFHVVSASPNEAQAQSMILSLLAKKAKLSPTS